MNTALLIIDPQNDFCEPQGALYVPGAEDDCRRLATFVDSQGPEIDHIAVTLDCHNQYAIFHPLFWRDSKNKPPAPFTQITLASLESRKYRPVDNNLAKYVKDYVSKLEQRGKYSLTIWPPHCLAATWGHALQQDLWNSLTAWEWQKPGRIIRYVYKGMNPLTEHYSAIRAEVPHGDDPSTEANMPLIDHLAQASQLIIAGEALSHCVANTVRDLLDHIPAHNMLVLTDCTSPVAGFAANPFIEEFVRSGITCTLADTLDL
jgi:nicotinamidase-related amidase